MWEERLGWKVIPCTEVGNAGRGPNWGGSVGRRGMRGECWTFRLCGTSVGTGMNCPLGEGLRAGCGQQPWWGRPCQGHLKSSHRDPRGSSPQAPGTRGVPAHRGVSADQVSESMVPLSSHPLPCPNPGDQKWKVTRGGGTRGVKVQRCLLPAPPPSGQGQASVRARGWALRWRGG